MGERVKWIEHKDKQILLADYSNLETEEIVTVIEESKNFVVNLDKYEIIHLVDVRNSHADRNVLNALKESAKMYKPYTKKTAVIGVTEIQKVLLKVVNTFSGLDVKLFNTIEEAKDWLVE